MQKRALAAALAISVGLLASLVMLRWIAGPQAPGDAGSKWSPDAAMVVTDVDGHEPMLSMGTTSRSASAEDPPDIVVDPDERGQSIVGFGAAMTHSSATLLRAMSAADRADLLDELFDPAGPVRLSALRIPIGASDFVAGDAFTFDDIPPGQSDWSLDHFNIQPDAVDLIPVLQEVLRINPRLTIIASPWSPPAWLKSGGSLAGGRLLDDDRAYDAYSRYLVRFIEEYRSAGIDIALLTPQNEPQLRHPDGYPGTDMPPWQQARLIDHLGPKLQAAGLPTRILAYDHNWDLHPADAASTPQGEDPAYQYPADVLRSEAAPWILGVAYHCYYGSPEAQSGLVKQFPTVEIWVTECSGTSSPGDSPRKVFADTLAWQSSNLLIPSLRNHARGVLTWNLVLDASGGPHHGGCTTCTGVVTIEADGRIRRNAEYALLAHAARYVPRESTRIGSSAADGQLLNVAFRTPSGGTAVLVWSGHAESRRISLGDGTTHVYAQLPPRSLSTITWRSANPGAR